MVHPQCLHFQVNVDFHHRSKLAPRDFMTCEVNVCTSLALSHEASAALMGALRVNRIFMCFGIAAVIKLALDWSGLTAD